MQERERGMHMGGTRYHLGVLGSMHCACAAATHARRGILFAQLLCWQSRGLDLLDAAQGDRYCYLCPKRQTRPLFKPIMPVEPTRGGAYSREHPYEEIKHRHACSTYE